MVSMSLETTPETIRKDALYKATHRGAECRLGVGPVRRRLSSSLVCDPVASFSEPKDESASRAEVCQGAIALSHDGAVFTIQEAPISDAHLLFR